MAATSHYPSASSTPPSSRFRRDAGCYAADQMYSSLASWQSLFTSDPPPTLHPEPVSGTFAPRLYHHSTAQEHIDCENIHPPPAQSPWGAHNARAVWGNSLAVDTYPARASAPYGEAALESTVPHPNPASQLGQSESMYRPMLPNHHPLPLPSTYTSTSASSQFPSAARRAAPVAHLLNYPAQSIRWPAGSSSDVPQAQHEVGLLNNPSVALSSGVVAPSIGSSSAPWSIIDVPPNSATASGFNRITDVETEWTLLQGPSEHETHPQAHHQNHHQPQLPLLNPNHHAPANWTPQQGQGSTAASKNKLPKVAASFTKRQPKRKISKRGQAGNGPLKFSQEVREEIKEMRNLKQCVRCKMYKIKVRVNLSQSSYTYRYTQCDPGKPCQKCQRIYGSQRIFTMSCSRDHLDGTSLVRHCNGRLNQSEASYLAFPWKDDVTYEMDISWNLPGFGHMRSRAPLRVEFREYVSDGQLANLDPTAQYWQNTAGQVNRISQPPYAIVETDRLAERVGEWFLANQPAIEAWILDRVKDDELSLLTYREVMRNRPGSDLLKTALKLQCLSIVSQGYGSVWSSNIAGIKEYDYPKLGRSEYEAYDRPGPDRPLPAAIAHQIDVAVLNCLKKLEKQCAKQLMRFIFQSGRKDWYQLFLTFFVLLWNLEYIHGSAESYIMSKSGTMLESQVSFVVRSQIVEWEHAAPIVLYHWQCVLRKFVPFKLARENPAELQNEKLVDALGLDYCMRAAHIVAGNGPERFSGPSMRHAPYRNAMAGKWIPQLFKLADG
ncbi:hypothetical protein BCR34DRAFT_112691 [Clohesyomyces aquaticus]|uniref:Uncharacterized protein n=1 Tax=Clohesyomyces aquaticus TaxID=1231657 RepID=A0A1Y1YQV2_9PLEO|nr:hypothetical protein BCR34DRAFT_112691 [Clohesyomyces aquaticus]